MTKVPLFTKQSCRIFVHVFVSICFNVSPYMGILCVRLGVWEGKVRLYDPSHLWYSLGSFDFLRNTVFLCSTVFLTFRPFYKILSFYKLFETMLIYCIYIVLPSCINSVPFYPDQLQQHDTTGRYHKAVS
jgi:hypothetical protein